MGLPLSSVEPDLSQSAAVFAALGDATRLEVVTRLCRQGPLSVTKLAEGSNVSRQAISKHLQVLADAGVVRGARHGRESRWALTPRGLGRARELLEAISNQWDDTLERLQHYLDTVDDG